jgi:DNA polymerase III delta prime subunit
MQKAANINELANNLIPENFLKPEDKDVYVPIYDKVLNVLRNMVIEDQVESQAFFAAGQAGTGKTTALNFFTTDALKDYYHIKYINMRDYLDLSDVDIIDFLLTFAFALVEGTALEKDYYKKLEEIKQIHEEEFIKTEDSESVKSTATGINGEVAAGGGLFNLFKFSARYFADLRMDTNYRETTRKVFKLKKPSLYNLTNEIIAEYVEKITGGKKLLVIIDDLDKLKKVAQINSIFIENRNYIFNLKCKKIISIPMYLTKAPEIFNYSQYPIRQFIMRLSSNPFEKDNTVIDKDKKKIESSRQLLREVIKCRVKKDCSLIEDEALEKAIDFSGGIIRQLVRIIYVAAVGVRTLKGDKISLTDVTGAVGLLRNTLAGTIASSEKIKLLNTVLKKNIPVSEEKEDFIELLQANNVLAYENGDPWYEINPIIRETVKTYAAKQEEE